MFKILTLFALLSILGFAQGTSLQSIPVLIPNSFSVFVNKDSEGITRHLTSAKNPDEWQFFYFCGNKKYKGKCGFWVDKKNNKIAGANNNVKKSGQEVTISKSVLGDAGSYAKFPENKDANQAYIERLDVYVQEGPKPPKL
ncbi:unnamed protein product [Caenorhabditis angaria]|uniref:CX domain-containing protein n=1 Tax=Caenorhabditis angaria TaxID=860376 RepID=A0A9P1IDQ8_9PELO|nr:unnamed protein product [Caenorhabditis angaria]